MQKLLQLRGRLDGEVQLGQGLHRGGIEQPQHDLLARDRRIGRHADVILRLQLAALDAAILRQRVLIRLEPREKLDATEHPLRHARRQRRDG